MCTEDKGKALLLSLFPFCPLCPSLPPGFFDPGTFYREVQRIVCEADKPARCAVEVRYSGDFLHLHPARKQRKHTGRFSGLKSCGGETRYVGSRSGRGRVVSGSSGSYGGSTTLASRSCMDSCKLGSRCQVPA